MTTRCQTTRVKCHGTCTCTLHPSTVKAKNINVQNCSVPSSHFFLACSFNDFFQKQRDACAGWKIYTSPGWFLEDWKGAWDEIFHMFVDGWDPMTAVHVRRSMVKLYLHGHEWLVVVVNVGRYADIPYMDLLDIKTPTTQTTGPRAYLIRHASIVVSNNLYVSTNVCKSMYAWYLGGGFKYFFFWTLLGEMIQFD